MMINIIRRGKEIARDIQVNEIKEKQPTQEDRIELRGLDIANKLPPDNGLP